MINSLFLSNGTFSSNTCDSMLLLTLSSSFTSTWYCGFCFNASIDDIIGFWDMFLLGYWLELYRNGLVEHFAGHSFGFEVRNEPYLLALQCFRVSEFVDHVHDRLPVVGVDYFLSESEIFLDHFFG